MKKHLQVRLSQSRAARNVVALASGFGASVSAGIASAAVDTTAITTGIADVGTAVAAIGSAVVLVFLGVKTFKWVRSSL